jgi:IS30 family transposase
MEVPLLHASPPPPYQRIARKAHHLHELGLSNTAIARRLGVTHHTVAKAITWHRVVSRATGSRSLP